MSYSKDEYENVHPVAKGENAQPREYIDLVGKVTPSPITPNPDGAPKYKSDGLTLADPQ